MEVLIRGDFKGNEVLKLWNFLSKGMKVLENFFTE